MQTTDCVLLPQAVIGQSSAAGLDPRKLAAESGLPDWALDGGYETTRVPSQCLLRLLELAERDLGDPQIAVRVAADCTRGDMGLYDYLFATSATFGDGLAVCGSYVGAVSTNFRFDTGPLSDRESQFELHVLNGEGRGKELAIQFAFARLMCRANRVTTRQVHPARVTFRQRPPRTRTVFADVFGSAAVDFDAPADTITFRRADFTVPLASASPTLAGILRRYAATLPSPPAHPTIWSARVAEVLASALNDGTASLDNVAKKLHVSPRTLQRRLAEAGTTWRKELHRARRVRRQGLTVRPDRRIP